MISVDILIPVYNEGGNIEKNLDALATGLENVKAEVKVYLLYDFDEDDTLPVARGFCDRYTFPVELLRNEGRGVIAAIKTGFSVGQADFALVTMADLSDDYSALGRMFALAEQGNDVVCGSRYMKGGALHGGPFLKGLLSRIAGVSAHYLSGIPTHDITNSYKLYRRSMLSHLEIRSLGGFEIGMEIAAKAYLNGYRVCECPSEWWDRTEGSSKFKLFEWLPSYLKWYLILLLNHPKPPVAPAPAKENALR